MVSENVRFPNVVNRLDFLQSDVRLIEVNVGTAIILDIANTDLAKGTGRKSGCHLQ